MTDRPAFEDLVADAMLAPSAHNTQPARWSQDGDVIKVFADLSRRLPIGDPTDRDLQIACGAAVEGTVLALAKHGLGAKVTLLTDSETGGLRHIADILPGGTPASDDVTLATYVNQRTTHRLGFSPTPDFALQDYVADHMTLVTAPQDIAWLAQKIDHSSAAIMKDRSFRAELLNWMRLRKDAVDYDTDGLNKEALAMDWFTAAITKPVLGTGLYDILSYIGLGPTLSGEAGRSRGAGGIALFHWPGDVSFVEAGRAFYRSWLEATRRGLVGWPAAALADDPLTRSAIETRFQIPNNSVIFNAIRLGKAKGTQPNRTRLAVSECILSRKSNCSPYQNN
jgi:hypothetical protein